MFHLAPLLRLAAHLGALALLSGTALAQFPPLGPPPSPPGNPITAEKAMLGQVLFWDEQLSSTRAVACGSCHGFGAGGQDTRLATFPTESVHPSADGLFGTADDVRGSMGNTYVDVAGAPAAEPTFGLARQVTHRRSMTMINAAYQEFFFWDGRAEEHFQDPITGATVLASGAALESLVVEPFLRVSEMGHEGRTWNDVVARIEAVEPLALSPSVPAALDAWIAGRDYDALFTDAFGTSGVTAARTCMAIATYMRTLVSDQTPFDDHLRGVPNAMTPAQQAGFQTFQVQFCAACHVPPALVGEDEITSFFYTGIRPRAEDRGRFEANNDTFFDGKMKAVDLRNVSLRAPYFHTGSMATLEDVLDFYERGGDFEVGTNDVLPMQPTSGTTRANLLDFLENALTDDRVVQGLPPFDHPALAFGTERMPETFAPGTAGSAGAAPRIHAYEAARLGTDDFTVALDGAPVGANAALLVSPTPDPAGTSFLGATLFVSRAPGYVAFQRVHNLAASASSGGWAAVDLELPSAAALAGTTLYAQWLVVDPHAGGMLSATPAVEFTLFD